MVPASELRTFSHLSFDSFLLVMKEKNKQQSKEKECFVLYFGKEVVILQAECVRILIYERAS